MAKRKVENQIANLTPDQKKSGTNPDLLSCRQCTTYYWKALNESYNFALDYTSIRGLFAKLWGSKVVRVPASTISGFPLKSLMKEKPFGCEPRGEVQRTPEEGEEAAAPSIIRIIQEVHGGKVMPSNGGIVRFENVQVKPLFPKGTFNTTLNFRVFGRAVRSNGFPSSHTNFNRRHLGLKKDFLKGIFVVEVFSAPFRP